MKIALTAIALLLSQAIATLAQYRSSSPDRFKTLKAFNTVHLGFRYQEQAPFSNHRYGAFSGEHVHFVKRSSGSYSHNDDDDVELTPRQSRAKHSAKAEQNGVMSIDTKNIRPFVLYDDELSPEEDIAGNNVHYRFPKPPHQSSVNENTMSENTVNENIANEITQREKVRDRYQLASEPDAAIKASDKQFGIKRALSRWMGMEGDNIFPERCMWRNYADSFGAIEGAEFPFRHMLIANHERYNAAKENNDPDRFTNYVNGVDEYASADPFIYLKLALYTLIERPQHEALQFFHTETDSIAEQQRIVFDATSKIKISRWNGQRTYTAPTAIMLGRWMDALYLLGTSSIPDKIPKVRLKIASIIRHIYGSRSCSVASPYMLIMLGTTILYNLDMYTSTATDRAAKATYKTFVRAKNLETYQKVTLITQYLFDEIPDPTQKEVRFDALYHLLYLINHDHITTLDYAIENMLNNMYVRGTTPKRDSTWSSWFVNMFSGTPHPPPAEQAQHSTFFRSLRSIGTILLEIGLESRHHLLEESKMYGLLDQTFDTLWDKSFASLQKVSEGERFLLESFRELGTDPITDSHGHELEIVLVPKFYSREETSSDSGTGSGHDLATPPAKARPDEHENLLEGRVNVLHPREFNSNAERDEGDEFGADNAESVAVASVPRDTTSLRSPPKEDKSVTLEFAPVNVNLYPVFFTPSLSSAHTNHKYMIFRSLPGMFGNDTNSYSG